MRSDDEQKQEHEVEGLIYADYRRAVQKYPSDNVGLDREYRTAYPSTTLLQFSALRREDKIDAVVKARIMLNVGNQRVTMSVEDLREGRDPDEFASPDPAPPPADASVAQILMFMQQQMRADKIEAEARARDARREAEARAEDARREAEARAEEVRREAEARAEEVRREAEAREERLRRESDEKIRILADQLQATRQSCITNDAKFDFRFKRAKELVGGVLGKMPDGGRDVLKYFESAERFFTMYSIDEDLKCPILNTLPSDKDKQLLHRIPVATSARLMTCVLTCYANSV